ncbi:MAG: MarR family transcriptional regulator, partial [Streptococcus mitis]|nr:MarR family transcriptional regulator [Streptococcus mitis]
AISTCGEDKRKKYLVLTELGQSQKEVGHRVSQKLDRIFYKGFSEEEIRQFEAFQERILANLKEEENEV